MQSVYKTAFLWLRHSLVESSYPSHGHYMFHNVVWIYTRYGVLFFVRKLLCKKLWGKWTRNAPKANIFTSTWWQEPTSFCAFTTLASWSTWTRCEKPPNRAHSHCRSCERLFSMHFFVLQNFLEKLLTFYLTFICSPFSFAKFLMKSS